MLAVLGALALTALLWLLLNGNEESSDTASSAPPAPPASEQARGLVAELSEQERVEQLLLAGVSPIDPAAVAAGKTGGPPAAGGYLIDTNSWPGAAAAPALTAALREGAAGSPVPPLIAAGQEGGEYRTFPDLPPRAREVAVGDLGQSDAAAAWSEQTARALDTAGIDLNLAPVADVATLDSPISDRAFSDDALVASRMTEAAIRGCRRGGIGCAPSHFPGLGGASADTGAGPATVSVDRATLLQRDLLPFRAAFEAGAPAVVVSHALYAGVDPVTPGSLSSEVLVGLLRSEAGFGGAAITDDLEAGAIRAGYRVPDAAVAAIAAGADMIQISEPEAVEGIREALTEAVASGSISAERLDQAVGRVIDLKRALGLL